MDWPAPPERLPLNWRLRVFLVAVVLGLVAVFTVAALLKPYDAEGKPLRMGAHEQMGLPSCSFQAMTGRPCPSCGMTTSFALLVRGDLLNSLNANWVGTFLAFAWMAALPWAVFCLLRNRVLFFRSLDRPLLWGVVIFLGVLFARWGLVLFFGGPYSPPLPFIR